MNAIATRPAAAPAKTARIRKMHDLADLFPEVPEIANSIARYFPGFQDAGPGVPARKPIFVQEQSFLEEFTYFNRRESAYIIVLCGPTGCGKTERVLDFYARLNIPVLHNAAHKNMKFHELVGSRTIATNEAGQQETPFIYGALPKAMKYGYPYILDEAYRLSSTVTSKLHMIRDRGELTIDETGETIKAKPGFKMILTANQRGYGDDTGFYGGDSEQDQAWLNGMPTIECGYPAADIETQIVQFTLESAHPGFKTEPTLLDFAPNMVKVANRIRSQYIGNEDSSSTDARVEIAISTRNLIEWADAFASFRGSSSKVHPLYRALDYVSLRKACLATRTFVDNVLLAEFGIKRTDKL